MLEWLFKKKKENDFEFPETLCKVTHKVLNDKQLKLIHLAKIDGSIYLVDSFNGKRYVVSDQILSHSQYEEDVLWLIRHDFLEKIGEEECRLTIKGRSVKEERYG